MQVDWTIDNGLSPLARGTLSDPDSSRAFVRFIPAGAGNTSPQVVDFNKLSVYPRWRGEHYRIFNNFSTVRGLSPLARGTQLVKKDGYFSKRFIPAGAGNTLAWWITTRRQTVYPRWRGEHASRFLINV